MVRDVTKFIPDSKVFDLVFLRGPRRSYIFVIHPERKEQFRVLLSRFVAGAWKEHFSLNDNVFCTPFKRTREEQQAVNWQVIKRFQKMYPTKEMKESALKEMPNEQIQNLIDAASIVQEKIFYASFRKNEEEARILDDTRITGVGFSAPAIGQAFPVDIKI